jgi:thiol-disulfide isomerase/thioredoxin
LIGVALALAAAVLVTGCGSTEFTGGTPEAQQTTQPTGRSAAAGTGKGQALRFSGTTLDGVSFDAADLAGKPVVLWFWAPWCTICRAEAPEVARIAAQYNGEVRFVGVPGRGEEVDMRRFVEDTGTGALTHVVDQDGSLWNRFGVIAQPAFVFVDRQGGVDSFNGSLPGDELRRAVAALANS